MAAIRRPAAAVTRPVAPVSSGVNFGEDSLYAGGFTLPEGDYALEFNVVMHAGTKQDGTPAGPERLGMMLSCYPLAGGDPQEQFLSFGSKAHLSFAPDPQTGKGLVPVPGGPTASMPSSTNWNIFRKSMYDCGLPVGIFTNDVSVLDGIHVHTMLVPEPEDRKGFGAKTGEAGQEERRGNGFIPIVSEIKEDGKPWEGTGGIPAAAPAAPAPRVARPAFVAVPAKRAVARPAAPAPVAVEEAAAPDDEELLTAAINGATAVLTNSPQGLTKLALRTGTFKAVNDANGAEMAQQVIETYFSSDDALNGLAGQLGYKVVGVQVKPA